jgi:GTPase SAR1 family protein
MENCSVKAKCSCVCNNSSASMEHHKEASKEFQDMMTFYFQENSPNKLHEDTPVLILANKIDLNPNFTKNK